MLKALSVCRSAEKIHTPQSQHKLLMSYTLSSDHTQSMQMLSLATASYLESVAVSPKSAENHVAGAAAEFLLVCARSARAIELNLID